MPADSWPGIEQMNLCVPALAGAVRVLQTAGPVGATTWKLLTVEMVRSWFVSEDVRQMLTCSPAVTLIVFGVNPVIMPVTLMTRGAAEAAGAPTAISAAAMATVATEAT